MVDSQSLRLVFASAKANDVIGEYVSKALIAKGFTLATSPVLAFLSELECGVNYASEVARRLGVSRQMVSKTVKGLSDSDLLEVLDDPERGNQKVIVFTAEGERLMAEARTVLAKLDESLKRELGDTKLEKMADDLSKVIDIMNKELKS